VEGRQLTGESPPKEATEGLREALGLQAEMRREFAAAVAGLEGRLEVARASFGELRACLDARAHGLEGTGHDLRLMRTALETEETLRQCLLARACLSAMDDLDRALTGLPPEAADWSTGVALVRRSLEATLTAAGVEGIPVGPGDRFDPAIHAAVGVEGETGEGSPVVRVVVLPGYRAGGKVLRPAQVRVCWLDAPERPSDQSTDAGVQPLEKE